MKYYYNFFVNNKIVYNFFSLNYIEIDKKEIIQLEYTSPAPENKKIYIDYDIENIEKFFKEAISPVKQLNLSFYTINLFLKEKKEELKNE